MRWYLAAILLAFALPARAEEGPAGVFDYYVLSLSWSPNWCARTGDARGAAQCAPGTGAGWVLHGLWPQYHRGWPAHCAGSAAAPSRALTRDMADIMGSSAAALYQWRKHGTCSGLSPRAYFAQARTAFARVVRPEVLRRLGAPVRLPAQVIEAAFLRANPGWTADMLTITCRDGDVQEARLCLSKALAPVPCGRDVARDCGLDDAMFRPLRR